NHAHPLHPPTSPVSSLSPFFPSHWAIICIIRHTHTQKHIHTYAPLIIPLLFFSLQLYFLPLFTYTHVQSSTQSPSMQAHLISLKSNRSPPPIPSLPLSTLSFPITMAW